MKLFPFIVLLLCGCASVPPPAPTAAQVQAETTEDVDAVMRLQQQLQKTGLGMPPAPPKPAVQMNSLEIQPVVVWLPPILTLAWDGCGLANVTDTVNESAALPPTWVPLASLPCTNGPMTFQITADQPQGFFIIKRASQPTQ